MRSIHPPRIAAHLRRFDAAATMFEDAITLSKADSAVMLELERRSIAALVGLMPLIDRT